MRPTTAQLEALVTVAETGSISAAAQVLRLAQPTVSATLARLERSAGTALLRRTSSGTCLTPEGETIRALALEALAGLDEVATALADLRAEPIPVRVAASFTIAEQLLPVWLSGLGVGVQVEVCNSRLAQEQVLHGQADVGFVEGTRVCAGLEASAVGKDELLLVVGPDHPWAARAEAVSAEELVRPTPVGPLVVREPGSGAREVLEEALSRCEMHVPTSVSVLGSTSAILTAVRHSGAHAVVPRAAAESFVELGRLVVVPVALDLRRRLLLVLPRGRQPRHQVRLLLEHLARVCPR